MPDAPAHIHPFGLSRWCRRCRLSRGVDFHTIVMLAAYSSLPATTRSFSLNVVLTTVYSLLHTLLSSTFSLDRASVMSTPRNYRGRPETPFDFATVCSVWLISESRYVGILETEHFGLPGVVPLLSDDGLLNSLNISGSSAP